MFREAGKRLHVELQISQLEKFSSGLFFFLREPTKSQRIWVTRRSKFLQEKTDKSNRLKYD